MLKYLSIIFRMNDPIVISEDMLLQQDKLERDESFQDRSGESGFCTASSSSSDTPWRVYQNEVTDSSSFDPPMHSSGIKSVNDSCDISEIVATNTNGLAKCKCK